MGIMGCGYLSNETNRGVYLRWPPLEMIYFWKYLNKRPMMGLPADVGMTQIHLMYDRESREEPYEAYIL